MYNGLMMNFSSRDKVKEFLEGLPAEHLPNVLLDVQKEKVKCLKLIRDIDQFLLMGKLMCGSFGQNIPKSMVFDTLGAKADNGSGRDNKKTQTMAVMPNSSLATPHRANPELPYLSNPKLARFKPTILGDLVSENKVG
jgi:hypothetical protein